MIMKERAAHDEAISKEKKLSKGYKDELTNTKKELQTVQGQLKVAKESLKEAKDQVKQTKVFETKTLQKSKTVVSKKGPAAKKGKLTTDKPQIGE